jgi:hypothetical protein
MDSEHHLPSLVIGPSPLKVLGSVVLLSVVGTLGLSALILFLGFAGTPWWLANARFLITWIVALLACFCGIAVIGAMIWGRPRIEIGPDGFVCQGIAGRRARRWTDIAGDFSTSRKWPWPVVAYRLTDAAKESTKTPPPPPPLTAPPAGYDECISFCGELAMGHSELAEVLNRRKQGPPA